MIHGSFGVGPKLVSALAHWFSWVPTLDIQLNCNALGMSAAYDGAGWGPKLPRMGQATARDIPTASDALERGQARPRRRRWEEAVMRLCKGRDQGM